MGLGIIFRQFICLFLSVILAVNPFLINIVNAAPQNDIEVDVSAHSSYKAHLKSSSKGVDVIDITAPTNSGISINHWERLNNTKGVIFNNSQYDGNSKIGGFVGANIYMSQPGNRSAAVILNQVNGVSRSHFSNITEIFGSQAQFIVSNPNGITCNGCGFIGAPKVTLTTGNPTYGGVGGDWTGSLLVSGGDVEIGILGFLGLSNDGDSVNDVSYVDIISRSMKVIGGLLAQNEVNIVVGRNGYDYNSGVVTKKVGEVDNSVKPEFAIDTAALITAIRQLISKSYYLFIANRLQIL